MTTGKTAQLITDIEVVGNGEDVLIMKLLDQLQEYNLQTRELRSLMARQREVSMARASLVVEASAALRELVTGRKWYEPAT